jgi:hypothetical protein
MPAFAGKLSDAEIIAVIAYIQNWCPDKIYSAWIERLDKSGISICGALLKIVNRKVIEEVGPRITGL